MIDSKKYMTTICILLGILIVSVVTINIFISSLTDIFTIFIDMIAAIISLSIIFSILITNKVIKDKKVNVLDMKINFKIVNLLFPIITFVADSVGISKNEIRKVYVKLNNKYIYSNKYNIKNEEILILIPHCVQRNSCKLKVTTNIETCAKCGLCDIGDLVKLKEKTNVNIFVATGGTLARKIIIDNKPKAIIAVACERDLTAGVQDVRKIPILGVFNKRPNGPCVDTSIDVKEIEEAIKFFTSN